MSRLVLLGLLGLTAFGCSHADAPVRSPNPARPTVPIFVNEGASAPTVTFLGSVFEFAQARETAGGLVNDYYKPGESSDNWTETVMAVLAPEGVGVGPFMAAYADARKPRMSSDPFATPRRHYDEEWLMVLPMMGKVDGQVDLDLVHVFANRGERARAFVYSRKDHRAMPSDEAETERALRFLTELASLGFPLVPAS